MALTGQPSLYLPHGGLHSAVPILVAGKRCKSTAHHPVQMCSHYLFALSQSMLNPVKMFSKPDKTNAWLRTDVKLHTIIHENMWLHQNQTHTSSVLSLPDSSELEQRLHPGISALLLPINAIVSEGRGLQNSVCQRWANMSFCTFGRNSLVSHRSNSSLLLSQVESSRICSQMCKSLPVVHHAYGQRASGYVKKRSKMLVQCPHNPDLLNSK